jgi:hypothetical protein
MRSSKVPAISKARKARASSENQRLGTKVRALRAELKAARAALRKQRLEAQRLWRDVRRPDVGADLIRLLRGLEPMRAEGARKIRIGRKSDGGYVMLDDFAGAEAAYSIGICDEASWDLEIADRGLPVFQYDHTIDAPPEAHPLLTWRKLGLGPADNPRSGLVTLRRMLAENGHARAQNLILKIDIEDAEWDVFAEVDRRVLRRFRQIVCEFHRWTDFPDPARAERMRRAFRALTRDHCVVHVHANNHGGYRIVAGVPLPDTLELSFARRSDWTFARGDEVFPTPLDAPNNPDFADYALGGFRF